MENYEFQRHEARDKFKWILSAIAIILLAVFLTAACTQGFTNANPWGWFGKNEEQTEELPDVDPGDKASGGLILPEVSEDNGINLAVRRLSAVEYYDYGIMPLAESAYTVTATVLDTAGQKYESEQDVTYSLAWSSTKSDAVTDYMSLSQSGTTATVTCLKAFDTQITLTATSTLDTSKSATATFDYAKRISGGSVSFKGNATAVTSTSKTIDVNFPSSYVVGGSMLTSTDWVSTNLNWFDSSSVTYGTGSIDNSINTWTATITPSAGFQSAYNSYKGSNLSDLKSSILIDKNSMTSAVGSVNNFYSYLGGYGSNVAASLSGYGGYRAFSLAFSETTNQFTVSVTVTPQYGDAYTFNYVLNVSVAAPNISSVTFDNSSFIF